MIFLVKILGTTLIKTVCLICTLLMILIKNLTGVVINPAVLALGEERVVISRLTRGYDFNNNNLLDVVGIAQRVNQKGQLTGPTRLILLELRPNSSIEKLWEYQPEKGSFIDVRIADIDNDGQKDFIAICQQDYASDHQSEWLYIFGVRRGKVIRKDISLVQNISQVRPEQMDIGDFNGDGKEDILISSGSPSRAAYLIIKETLDNRDNIFTLKKIDLEPGISKFSILAANIDTTKGDEIIMVSGQESVKLFSYNLQKGQISPEPFILQEEKVTNLLKSNLATANIDGKYLDEIILPFKNGRNYILSANHKTFDYTFFRSNDKAISHLSVKDMDGNGREDLFYNLEQGVKVFRIEAAPSKKISNLKLNSTSYSNPFFTNVVFLDITFSLGNSEPFSQAMLIPYLNRDHNIHGLSYWMLDKSIESSYQQIDSTIIREIDKIQQQKSGLADFTRINEIVSEYSGIKGDPVPFATPPQRPYLIAGKTIDEQKFEYDFIVQHGDTFHYKIDTTKFDQNGQLSVIGLGNIQFNSDSSEIFWDTQREPIGKNNIIISKGDSSEILKLYINSPPVLTSQPIRHTILQIGETYFFDLDVKDKNSDAAIYYKLVSYPEGAHIDANGRITWKPSFFQKDWHDFKVIVSDYFDSTAAEFSIFVNHPPSITSQIPRSIQPGKNLNYKIQVDDNIGAFLEIKDQAIRIDNHYNNKICRFRLLNHNPERYINKFKQLSPQSNIKSVYQVQNSLVLVYTDPENKFNNKQIVNLFFERLNMYPQGYEMMDIPAIYKYSLTEKPDNISITQNGVIKWTPQKNQVGWNRISYVVSDGYFTDESIDSIYVNSPIKIVSKLDTMIYSDSLWQYEIATKDLNKDQHVNYTLLNNPEDMDITENGIISWQPKNIGYREFTFDIIVDDGLSSDTLSARIAVNQQPEITTIPHKTAWTDIVYKYKIKARDQAGDSLIYKALEIPGNARFDSEQQLLTWRPGSRQSGPNKVVIRVIDSHGGFADQSFYINVKRSTRTKNKVIITTAFSISAILGLLYIFAF